MEELYPGYVPQGGGFKVNGFAATSPVKGMTLRPQSDGQIIAGFWNFGNLCFFVQQSSGTGNPRFSFRPLTTQFLANAIGNDAEFEFLLAQPRIGDVTYVSGAAAREFGAGVSQGIITLNANGNWSKKGLHFNLYGELGNNSALLNEPTLDAFKQASYFLQLDIPWSVLRFIFYDKMNFVISNYNMYGLSNST